MRHYLETFFFGVLAALGSLIVIGIIGALSVVTVFSNFNSMQHLYLPKFITFAVIVEEFFKYILLRKKIGAFSKRIDFAASAFFLGLGFSMVELAFILFQNRNLAEVIPNISKLTALHLLTSVILGYFLFIFRENKKLQIMAILPAIALHLTYNLTSSGGGDTLSVLAISFFLFLLLILIKDTLPKIFAFGKNIFYNKSGEK